MSTTQTHTATTEPPATSTETPSDDHPAHDPHGAPATFDVGCRRRLGCLVDAENESVSPAYTTRTD